MAELVQPNAGKTETEQSIASQLDTYRFEHDRPGVNNVVNGGYSFEVGVGVASDGEAIVDAVVFFMLALFNFSSSPLASPFSFGFLSFFFSFLFGLLFFSFPRKS
ncbi:hypothetical protein F4824DRAFT_506557 [Ustulina deusta]|nr:hypothetical protein F4824DRAFT_506557 [Ustulina deusta]